VTFQALYLITYVWQNQIGQKGYLFGQNLFWVSIAGQL